MLSFKKSPSAYERKAQELEARIENAQAAVADLEAEYQQECLQTVDGVTVAPVELRGQLAEARYTLQDLLAAKRGLQSHRGEIERVAAENEVKRQEAEAIMKRQARAAQDMDKAITAFVDARRELLSISAELFSAQSHPQLHKRQHVQPGCALNVDAAIQLRMKAEGITWALERTPFAPPPTITEHVSKAIEAANVDMEGKA